MAARRPVASKRTSAPAPDTSAKAQPAPKPAPKAQPAPKAKPAPRAKSKAQSKAKPKPGTFRVAPDDPRNDPRIGPGGKVDPYALMASRSAQVAAPTPAPLAEVPDPQAPGVPEPDDDAPTTPEAIRFELQHDLDKRLDKYLTDRIDFLSRTQLQRLIDEGAITVNARPAKASTRVHQGDVIEVRVPPPPAKDIQPEDIPLEVMFEDEHLIVINKSPDIIVHPARSENKGTMLSALAFHFQRTGHGHLSTVGKEFARPGVVHRLDRDTSGCIVFAKTDQAHWKLGRQFELRSVDKRYLALVHGHVEPDVFVIDEPIGPHPSREKGYREKYVVRHDELGKPSTTVVRVLERFTLPTSKAAPAPATHAAPMSAPRSPAGAPAGGAGWAPPPLPARVDLPAHRSLFETDTSRLSLVALELKTGRTHQIRVHLSHNLWPIVGDDMYGGKVYRSAQGQELLARQALHAAILAFRHPISGEQLRFSAPVPADIARTLRDLRARATTTGPLPTPGVSTSQADAAS